MTISVPLKTLDRVRHGDIDYLIVELSVDNGVPTVGCIPITNQIVYFPAEDIKLSNDDEAARRSLPHYMRNKVVEVQPTEIIPVVSSAISNEHEPEHETQTASEQVEQTQSEVDKDSEQENPIPPLVDLADALVYVIEQLETEESLDVSLLKSIYNNLKRFSEANPNHPFKVKLLSVEHQLDAVMGVAMMNEDDEGISDKPYQIRDKSFVSSLVDDLSETQQTLSEIE